MCHLVAVAKPLLMFKVLQSSGAVGMCSLCATDLKLDGEFKDAEHAMRALQREFKKHCAAKHAREDGAAVVISRKPKHET